jgi:hypothetical protein
VNRAALGLFADAAPRRAFSSRYCTVATRAAWLRGALSERFQCHVIPVEDDAHIQKEADLLIACRPSFPQ